YEGVVPVARRLSRAGFSLLATRGTGAHLRAAGLVVEVVNKVSQGGPHIVDALRRGEVALVVNTPAGADSQRDAFHIRRTALECRVPYFTTLAAAAAAAEGIDLMGRGPFTVCPLQEHHRPAARRRAGALRPRDRRGPPLPPAIPLRGPARAPPARPAPRRRGGDGGGRGRPRPRGARGPPRPARPRGRAARRRRAPPPRLV